MIRLTAGPWRAAWECWACGERLTFSQLTGSRGVCPHCGARSSGTVVSARKLSVRTLYRARFFGLLRVRDGEEVAKV